MPIIPLICIVQAIYSKHVPDYFEKGLDINEIAARLKITTSQASYFFWNVLIKYRVYVQDNLLQHNLISQNQQQQ